MLDSVYTAESFILILSSVNLCSFLTKSAQFQHKTLILFISHKLSISVLVYWDQSSPELGSLFLEPKIHTFENLFGYHNQSQIGWIFKSQASESYCLYDSGPMVPQYCRGQSLSELSESRYMLRLYVCYGCMSFCQSINLLLPICQSGPLFYIIVRLGCLYPQVKP